MNNDMNFEFELKQRFDTEAPELPEALKKENVMKMLENDNYVPKKKKHIFAKTLAFAASLLIVCTSVYALPLIIPEKGLKEALPNKTVYQNPPEYEVIDNGFKATKLMQAESTEALKNHKHLQECGVHFDETGNICLAKKIVSSVSEMIK